MEQLFILRNIFHGFHLTLITYPLQKLRVNKALFRIVTRGMNVIHSTDDNLIWFSTDVKSSLLYDSEYIYVNLNKTILLHEFLTRFQNYEPVFKYSLTKSDHKRGNQLRKRLGIPKDAPIVTVHMREAGYKNLHGRPEGPDGQLRNVTPENYVPAIDYLLSKNFYVIRLGDKTMTRLNINKPNYIELPFHSEYCDFSDLYFVAVSLFFIGCSSGPTSIAEIFGVPQLTINAYAHFQVRAWKNDILIFKEYYSHHLGRSLTWEEILSSPALFIKDVNHNLGFEIKENSPKDIFSATKEMISRLDGTYFKENEMKALIDHFKEIQLKASTIQAEKKKEHSFLNTGLLNFVGQNSFPLSVEYLRANPNFMGHDWAQKLEFLHI